jgi:hypothetical protein
MAELAFAQGLQSFVAVLSAMAAKFISIPLSSSEMRAESGATVATTEAIAKINARNMRGQAIGYYKKAIDLSQLHKRSTVSQIKVSSRCLAEPVRPRQMPG